MARSNTQRLAVAGSVLALALGVGWVHAPILFGDARLTAHHDNLDGAAPLRLEAARQWKSGRVPLWNSYKRAGMPLLADTTAGAGYPGNFPILFVEPVGPAEDGASPTDRARSPLFEAMDQVAALHALLAGLFLFTFLRAVGLAPAAAAFGGLVYGCCGVMTWIAAWYIQFQNSAVWLPLILAAVHRVATSREKTAAWVTVGASAVALQFFAGYPEASFYSGLLAVAYGTSLITRKEWWRPPLAVASIYVAGLLLCAVQLLPSLELQALARRPAALTLEVFQSLPASISMVTAWAWPPTADSPEFPPAAAYHFGAAAVAAALLGLAGRSRTSIFFVVVFVVSFALSVGDATPVNGWLHSVPGMSAFRHPFKHLFELCFALSALAGLGADRVLRHRPGAAWPLALVACAALATCVSLRSNLTRLAEINPPLVDTSGRRPEIVDRLEDDWRVMTQRSFFQARDPRFLLGDYPSQFRVPAVQGSGPFLRATLGEAAGMVEEENELRPGLFDARDRLLALLSCRYVVQTQGRGGLVPRVDPTVWKTVAEWDQLRLVEREDALPRFRFVSTVRCSDGPTMAASLRGEAADPGDLALVDCSSGERPSLHWTDPEDLSLRVLAEGPGFYRLATDVPDDGRAFLVVSQTDYPGWQASADGRQLPIRRVHGLVQGVEIPGGTTRVDLVYRPTPFVIGAATSTATLLALLIGIVADRRRNPSGV